MKPEILKDKHGSKDSTEICITVKQLSNKGPIRHNGYTKGNK